MTAAEDTAAAIDADPVVAARAAARAALFKALEAFIAAGARAGLGELRRAHERWAALGRDGE